MMRRLAQMDEHTRRRVIYMAVAVAGLLCYRIFTDGPIKQLQAVQSQYAIAVQRQTEMDSLNLDLGLLHKDFDKARQTLGEMQRQCVAPAEAAAFFEGLNAVATAHGLQPISTTLSPQRRLFEDAAFGLGEREVLQQAEVVVSGDFNALLLYLNDLTEGHGKIFLSKMRIKTASGDDCTPLASFQVSIVVDISNEEKP